MQSWLTLPERLQQRTFIREERLSSAQKAMLDWARIDEHAAVLDMDCSDGRLLNHCLATYSNIRACGILPYNTPCTLMEELSKRGAEVFRGEKHDIPWRDESFDTIFINALPNNIEDAHFVLSDILRVMKPGAQLLIMQPGFYLLPPNRQTSNNFNDLDHPSRIMSLLHSMGFSDVSARVTRLRFAVILAHRSEQI